MNFYRRFERIRVLELPRPQSLRRCPFPVSPHRGQQIGKAPRANTRPYYLVLSRLVSEFILEHEFLINEYIG